MRKRLLTAGLLGILYVAGFATQAHAQPYGGDPGVSFNAFYDALSPYGEWVDVEPYGRVWRPYTEVVGADFRPYATGGQWVYTDYGWTWESQWDWGWAPFHYGRWWMDPAYGWVWVPDTTWGPAWVDWRYGSGYVGWAPLAPVGAAIVLEQYRPAWCFVETRHFVYPNVYAYAMPWHRRYFDATYAVREEVHYGRSHWYAGPSPTHIATAVGEPIRPVRMTPPSPGAIRPVHISSMPSYGRPPAAQGGYTPPPQGGGFGHAPGNEGHRGPPSGVDSRGGYPPPSHVGSGAWNPPGHGNGNGSEHTWGGRPMPLERPPSNVPPPSSATPPSYSMPPASHGGGAPPAFHGGGAPSYSTPPASHGGGAPSYSAPPASHGSDARSYSAPPASHGGGAPSSPAPQGGGAAPGRPPGHDRH